ncbi:hypothetical protein Taro_019745 [Colocasia esculenta]|uniref:Uncharacterized protein n=1 Tax=Colocasia esculenta TaxID=4460 RepID=A0A843ULT9_COLES|nr:hypothetical protein [Colocasia esculenta]
MFKANYPPYGRDFTTCRPTGRFCDGKRVTDFTGKHIDIFASSFSGEEHSISHIIMCKLDVLGVVCDHHLQRLKQILSHKALPLGKQPEFYKECQAKLIRAEGEGKAGAILAGAMHLVSTGNGDYTSNLQKRYTRDKFSSLLLSSSFATFVKDNGDPSHDPYILHQFRRLIHQQAMHGRCREDLYGLVGRRIGVSRRCRRWAASAPISLFGHEGRNTCIAQFNADAEAFNRDLNATVNRLSSELPGLTFVVLDIYQPLMASPSKHGFTEVRKGSCGTGTSRMLVLCSFTEDVKECSRMDPG